MPLISRDGSAEASTSRAAWPAGVSLREGPVGEENVASVGGSSAANASASRALSDQPPHADACISAPNTSNTSANSTPPVTSLVDSGDGPRRRRRINVPPSLHSMIAGAGAGLVSSIATCPLDVVKTTLQAQSVPRGTKGYEGVTKTCMRIYRQSGVRGFYRGLGPTILGYLPTWGIYFTVYDMIKDRLRRVPFATRHPDASHVVAAMVAGATGTILTNPLWVVKTRFMAQAILPPSAPRYRTTWDAVRTIYKNEGFRAFYKGLLPSLFGVTHVAVQFGLYEKCKTLWVHDGHTLTPTAILACSAFSKMVASLATYPHEVLRTRIQVSRYRPPGSRPDAGGAAGGQGRVGSGGAKAVASSRPPPVPPTPAPAAPKAPSASIPALPPQPQTVPPTAHLYSPLVTGSNPPFSAEPEAANGSNTAQRRWRPKKGGIIDVFRKIYRQDGWRGFYRGLSINLVRTVPSSAVTMLTYELIMRHLA